MPTWNSRGLRGSTLEDLINLTNEKYRDSRIALIQKIPTPIKPIQINQSTRQITLAYFEKISTVDYIGVVQGVPVCFDAKECAKDNFSLGNLHEHQMEFMREFEEQDGIAFILLYYTHRNEAYYIPFRDVRKFYDRGKNGGLKHFKYSEIDKSYQVHAKKGVPIHYLEGLQRDLQMRDLEMSEKK